MVQILVQLDEQLAKQLEQVAPGRSRRRSHFIRLAIQRALMDLQESKTREAYLKTPDDEPRYFNPEVWSPERWDSDRATPKSKPARRRTRAPIRKARGGTRHRRR